MRRLGPAVTVLALPVAMIKASFRALLVAAVRLPALMNARLLTAGQAAIALSTITAGAQKENGAALAAQANPQPENKLTIVGHARRRAQLDNSSRFVSP